jgi:hypothetical protein
MSITSATPAATQFASIIGFGATGTMQGGTATNVETLMGNAATGIKLYVLLGAAEGGAATLAFTVEKNGADAAITCTVGNSATTCNDTVHTFTWAAGDRLSYKSIQSGTGTAQTIKVSLAYQ